MGSPTIIVPTTVSEVALEPTPYMLLHETLGGTLVPQLMFLALVAERLHDVLQALTEELIRHPGIGGRTVPHEAQRER